MSAEFPRSQLTAAYKHSRGNREDVLASKLCGCFHCLKTFPPRRVTEWIEEPRDKGETAMCPYCGIDSVLGANPGFPTTRKFLSAMQARYFGGV
jgi:hypothetical protein